jgi:hypothetical protein
MNFYDHEGFCTVSGDKILRDHEAAQCGAVVVAAWWWRRGGGG